ncbi:hypothetical protein [Kitasatospora acidiphila]|uniref:hypothetical protein n=1 Tax=Kitasatospora acidiphila TaxID=2567942 RepID=UPI003C752002
MSTQRRALGTGPSAPEPTLGPSAGTRRLPVEAAAIAPRIDVEHQAVEQLAPPRRRPLGSGPAGPIGPDRP